MWFVIAFPLFSAGVENLIAQNYWPAGSKLFVAFSKSLFICILGGYAWFMMVLHEYANYLIKSNWRKWSLKGFAASVDPQFIINFLWKSFAFWVTAHTFTYLLSGEWRVFMAAILSVVLGFFLSVAKRQKMTA